MLARRTVLRNISQGIAALPLAGLPLAAVLADPALAHAAAQRLKAVSLTLPGGKTVDATLALPAKTPAPAVLLVHEWWGLNDQIKAVAAELAKEGYVALAVDLYNGRVAITPEKARHYMKAVDGAAATETLAGWIDWLRARGDVAGKVGTVGWCFGGGWSLNASLARPVDATVVYYGQVVKTAAELAPLTSPVLGHFATRDRWIDEDMVAEFQEQMKAAGKTLQEYWYSADHAFANPTGARYDAPDAAKAWQRTLAFLKEHLA